ncbi:PP2C family protein-serine/threonine phosphatase [Microseira wollei]|uniref:Serine phosphatase n=1 Tax=Microseira wollei NIES-4236 TaxID=2530354 RepID=A0AAV3X715_9CYAN|nr:PP2C family protein-serine/threonine phosphatase [Microseira wollei]GET35875.1 serine phosphatase [Microseira wollei NIES-4236]
MLNKLAKLLKTRLSRRVVFWLFTSVIVIEAIVLVPSVLRREQELLGQLRQISTEKVSILMKVSPPQASPENVLNLLANLKGSSVIVGGSLYQSNGQRVGTFGEQPALIFQDVDAAEKKDLLDYQLSRYDVAWTAVELGKDYLLILRHDATMVARGVRGFILRVIGLVIIISLFVTAGTWNALQRIVIAPIVNLRKDLRKAAECICYDQPNPQFDSNFFKRNDELGEVIFTFQEMYQQIYQAIDQRKQAEFALKNSYDQIEIYSKTLNLELEKGRQIQLNFLPSSDELKQIYLKSGWEFSAFFKPARQVAGDFYDIFELSNNAIGIAIADVCDKGVGAALFMALFRSLIRIFSQETKLRGTASNLLEMYQPKAGWIGSSSTVNLAHLNALQSVNLTNDYVARHHGSLGMFATLFFGVLDPQTGLLTYINAGHEPVFILNPQAGIREILTSTSPAIGILSNAKFSISQVYLQPNEILFGFTDGVTDARDCQNSFFTIEKLRHLLQFCPPKASDIVDYISLNVLSHTQGAEQFDDITLLAVQHSVLE